MPFLKSFELGVFLEILATFRRPWTPTHNFGYKYSSKSIKDFIDANFDLVFNKTSSEKNRSMGWVPGSAKSGQNF